MKFRETWLAAFAMASIGAGGCYVETPKHDLADAEAIRAAAREDASAGEEDAEVEDAGVSDAGRSDSGVDAEVDADTCACEGESPVCLASGGCGQCDDDNPCAAEQLCNSQTHSCVACIEDSDCATAEAPICTAGVCAPCGNSEDCKGVAGKGVCHEQVCVECTPEDDDACLVGDQPGACHPAQFACTGKIKAQTPSCGECQSDEECAVGSYCALDIPAGAGRTGVCMRALTLVPALPCPKPYVGDTPEPVRTANGQEVQLCTLRLSTCEAADDYLVGKRCGTPKLTIPAEDMADSGRNEECGAAGEGYCVYAPAFLQFRCTVPCQPESGAPDCPGSGTRTCRSLTHAGGGPLLNLCAP